jgi:hypothetical protein
VIEFGNGRGTTLRYAPAKRVVLPEEETCAKSDGEVLDDVSPERAKVKTFF